MAGLPSDPMWTSPDALNDTHSPRRTVTPVGVHCCWEGIVIPGPVATPLLEAEPLVAAALSGRDMTIRAMSFDEKSRSPEGVRNVIRSGDDPPMSTSWPVMVSPLFRINT